jgi:hypothetical protein
MARSMFEPDSCIGRSDITDLVIYYTHSCISLSSVATTSAENAMYILCLEYISQRNEVEQSIYHEHSMANSILSYSNIGAIELKKATDTPHTTRGMCRRARKSFLAILGLAEFNRVCRVTFITFSIHVAFVTIGHLKIFSFDIQQSFYNIRSSRHDCQDGDCTADTASIRAPSTRYPCIQ